MNIIEILGIVAATAVAVIILVTVFKNQKQALDQRAIRNNLEKRNQKMVWHLRYMLWVLVTMNIFALMVWVYIWIEHMLPLAAGIPVIAALAAIIIIFKYRIFEWKIIVIVNLVFLLTMPILIIGSMFWGISSLCPICFS